MEFRVRWLEIMKIPGGPTLISPWRLVNQHFIKKRVFWYITFISISHGWNDLWISHLSWHPRPPLFSEPQINSYLVEKTFVVLWKFWKSFRHCKSSRLLRDWFVYFWLLLEFHFSSTIWHIEGVCVAREVLARVLNMIKCALYLHIPEL